MTLKPSGKAAKSSSSFIEERRGRRARGETPDAIGETCRECAEVFRGD